MPELIGKLQATFKNTLHSSPQIFSLAVYRLRGDCKSPGFIGRTFLYDGLQIRRNCIFLSSAGTPDGRFFTIRQYYHDDLSVTP